jgi:hypothetical protein
MTPFFFRTFIKACLFLQVRLQRTAEGGEDHEQRPDCGGPPLHPVLPGQRGQVCGALLPPGPPRRPAQPEVHPQACGRGAQETTQQRNDHNKWQ